MFIVLWDDYGSKEMFSTTSTVVPKVGDEVDTPKFSGKCEKVLYSYDEDSCTITVRVK